MSRRLLLVLALAGCETDDFFISDGGDHCPSETGETDGDADEQPTTSSVMPEPLTEITTGLEPTDPTTPPDPRSPGHAPAQERP